MSTVNDTDLLLVERNGTQYQITLDEMSTLNDDDLLLVERGGVQYKIEAQYVSTGPDGVILPPVEVLTPVNGAGLNEGDPYTPISSAYVSTDTTPIHYRWFPELITTVSGGVWVNENQLFNGSTTSYAELTADPDAVSQVIFTPQDGWFEGETTVHIFGSDGGIIEILDDTNTVLRTYSFFTSAAGYAVGIVRADQRIRFTTNGQNQSLSIARISGTPIDYVISGRVAFEFTDDTDLDKMVAPIIMTDENGDIKVPTTSTVDSTTTIPGENKSLQASWFANGNQQSYLNNDSIPLDQRPPGGSRMTWTKTSNTYTGAISDNVANSGAVLLTSSSGTSIGGGPTLSDTQSVYPVNAYWNESGATSYIAEIGVAPKILDIVTYSGSSTVRSIPHNLGCKPGMIIIKSIRNGSQVWTVWHKDLDPTGFMRLNSTSTPGSSTAYFNSEPTADAIFLGSGGNVNDIGVDYVAYIYAADTPGKVLCGSYVGNGGTTYINAGFQAGFILIKRTNGSSDWIATTEQASSTYKYWHPNRGNVGVVGSSSQHVDIFSSTQIALVGGSSTDYNYSGAEYVYLAVAADLTGPNSTQLNLLSGQDLEYFTDGTEITSNLAASGSNISFGTTTYTGNSGAATINPTVGGQTFMDTQLSSANKWLIWIKATNANYDHYWVDSERHPDRFLISNLSSDEAPTTTGYQGPNGAIGYELGMSGVVNASGINYTSWNFQGAPQFFDVVKYVGDDTSSHVIEHDLGAEPGMVIIKRLTTDENWWVYHSNSNNAIPTTHYLHLNNPGGSIYLGTEWIQVTDSSITITDGRNEVNSSGYDYIAYIFAKDTPYVKCGHYTSTGTGTVVDVGFQPRWMMIKKISNTGGWIVFDKNMASNTYLKANDDAVAGSYAWNFTSSGISLNGAWGEVADNGQEYIYIAIADETEGHPPNFPSSSTVVGTPDVNTATMVVNAESFDTGDSASAPALEASITAVGGSEGNTLYVDGSTGTWLPGLYAKGTEITLDAPSPDEVVFTSMNQGTTPFSGVDATLSSRTWTLESGSSATGPWTVVDTYVDYDAQASQDGATPWTSNKPNLTPNTFYRVKCQYDSTNAESVESVYHTFKTSA